MMFENIDLYDMNDEEFVMLIADHGYRFLVKYFNEVDPKEDNDYKRRLDNYTRSHFPNDFSWYGRYNKGLDVLIKQTNAFKHLDKINLIKHLGKRKFLDKFEVFITIDLMCSYGNEPMEVHYEYIYLLYDEIKLLSTIGEQIYTDHEFLNEVSNVELDILEGLESVISDYNVDIAVFKYPDGLLYTGKNTPDFQENPVKVPEGYKKLLKMDEEIMKGVIVSLCGFNDLMHEHPLYSMFNDLFIRNKKIKESDEFLYLKPEARFMYSILERVILFYDPDNYSSNDPNLWNLNEYYFYYEKTNRFPTFDDLFHHMVKNTLC